MSLLDVPAFGADRTDRPWDPVRRRAARTAGLGLAAMAVLAVPAAVGLASDSPVAVRAAASTFVVVAVLDVVVGLALGRLLRPVSPGWASAAAWTRVAYGAGFAAVAGVLAAAPDAAAADRFQDRWDLLLVLFGVHLLLVTVGLLVRRTAPLLVGAATALAGASYVVGPVAEQVFPDVDLGFLAVFGVGELVLTGWLLWRSRARASRRPA